MKNQNRIRLLAESAVMIALAVVLDMIKIIQMPLGGNVTLVSMLPIMLVSIKNGPKWGFATSAVYACYQTFMSVSEVMSWGLSVKILLACLFLDYLFPYFILGIAGIFGKKNVGAPLAGITLAVLLRFLSHFLSGTVLFGNWEDGVWNCVWYSIAYNGTYLLPELGLTLLVAGLLFAIPSFRRMVGISK